MLPSEKLRKEIEETHNLNLEKYAWNAHLKQQIFSIELDDTIETQATNLKEIYEHGFNIGHCGLTSRYICRRFDAAKLFYGKASLLVGTKSSPNGEHAWTNINGLVIDTTLMICMRENLAKELSCEVGYKILNYTKSLL